jgi:hypothetical protein
VSLAAQARTAPTPSSNSIFSGFAARLEPVVGQTPEGGFSSCGSSCGSGVPFMLPAADA